MTSVTIAFEVENIRLDLTLREGRLERESTGELEITPSELSDALENSSSGDIEHFMDELLDLLDGDLERYLTEYFQSRGHKLSVQEVGEE